MKIICIGRNYANHAKEMNAEVPKQPLFFMKPDTALLPKKMPFFYPNFSNDIHHECEIVIRIQKVGKNIPEKHAHEFYSEIGIGIDFTARDLQKVCKEKGQPWEIAKSFEHSAPVSERFIPVKDIDITNLNFSLQKNGETVQKGNTKDLLFSFDKIISYISQFMTLKIGDLIFTGTPEGVGPIKIGDTLTCKIEDQTLLSLNIK